MLRHVETCSPGIPCCFFLSAANATARKHCGLAWHRFVQTHVSRVACARSQCIMRSSCPNTSKTIQEESQATLPQQLQAMESANACPHLLAMSGSRTQCQGTANAQPTSRCEHAASFQKIPTTSAGVKAWKYCNLNGLKPCATNQSKC